MASAGCPFFCLIWRVVGLIKRKATRGVLVDWQKEQLIAYIESRISDWIARDPEPGCPSRIDLEVWLSRKRDELPWGKIGLKYYGSENAAAMSKARRTYERVRRYHPGIEKKPRRKPGPKPRLKI